MPERMRVAQRLWKADISAEYSHQDNPKLVKQLDEALERGIPYMVRPPCDLESTHHVLHAH